MNESSSGGPIPGRGRRDAGVQFEQVWRDVMCVRGHKVGMVWKNLAAGPRSPYNASGMQFTDTTLGGKIEARCPRCGDHVQIRWDRVRSVLDEAERLGAPDGTIRA